MKQPTILFVGTVTPPYTGQAVAFEEAYRHMLGEKYLVNQNFEDRSTSVKVLLLLGSFFKIWYFLIFKKLDIVYFVCSRTTIGSLKDLILVYSAKLFGLKVINHLHGARLCEFIERLPKPYRAVVMDVYSRIDVSIVLLESMKQEFLQFWPEMDVRVVPNFYAAEFETVGEKKPHTHVTLVYLSNIIYSKGILDLVDAFTILASHSADVELIIAGDFIGDEYYSRHEIQKLFLEKIKGIERISFVGVVSGKVKVDLLAKSDTFVLPTFYSMEAFPLSIIEAMRSGNAIVTTDHNYLGEIVEPSMGCLVPKNAPQELAVILEMLIGDKERMHAMQNYNRTYASEYFSLAQYVVKLDSIMEDTLR